MTLREYRAWSDFDREQDDVRVYDAGEVDALLTKLRGLTCKAEGWEDGQDVIVAHGIGIIGASLSPRDARAVERWLPGGIAELIDRLMTGGEW